MARRVLLGLAGLAGLAGLGCTSVDDSPYTRQKNVIGSPETPVFDGWAPPGAPTDSGLLDGATDQGVDASSTDTGPADATSGPDAGLTADAESAPECSNSGDCLMVVALTTCAPCPIPVPRTRSDADPCLVVYDATRSLSLTEPISCTEGCEIVDELCSEGFLEAVCLQGACVAR